MILSGLQINELAKRDNTPIVIRPFDAGCLNPNSYNLHLHNELLVYTEPELDMKKDNPYRIFTIPDDGFVIQPGKLYLGRTAEYTKTDKYVPMLEGRSSVGRLGLSIHVTAGFGDVGFAGYWTLEIHAVVPVRIYAGVEICQIYYHDIDLNHEIYKSSKYQGNEGIQPSMMWKDFQ